jgi:hypothetical protein
VDPKLKEALLRSAMLHYATSSTHLCVAFLLLYYGWPVIGGLALITGVIDVLHTLIAHYRGDIA